MRASRRPNSSTPSPLNLHTDRGNYPFMTSRAKFATQPSFAIELMDGLLGFRHRVVYANTALFRHVCLLRGEKTGSLLERQSLGEACSSRPS
jgi:hypothetical protein